LFGVGENNFTGMIILKNRAFPDGVSATIELLKSTIRGNYPTELGLDGQLNITSHRHRGTVSFLAI
jgi:hypothetical protein